MSQIFSLTQLGARNSFLKFLIKSFAYLFIVKILVRQKKKKIKSKGKDLSQGRFIDSMMGDPGSYVANYWC